MENKAGFSLLIFDVELIEENMEFLNTYTFQKTEGGSAYRVALDDEGYILGERMSIPSDECDYELERYPEVGAAGYNNNPFKTLDFDPTAE